MEVIKQKTKVLEISFFFLKALSKEIPILPASLWAFSISACLFFSPLDFPDALISWQRKVKSFLDSLTRGCQHCRPHQLSMCVQLHRNYRIFAAVLWNYMFSFPGKQDTF